MTIQAVLFDLDGTLWSHIPPNFDWADVQRSQAEGLRPHFERLGFELDLDEFIRRFFANLYEFQNPPTEDFSEAQWHPVLERTLAAHGYSANDADAALLFEVMNETPFRALGISAFADAAPALHELSARGFRMGAVTNNPKPAARLAREIRDLGLPDVFEVIVSSWDCGWRKPHHLPFETALAALGAAPEETAHVGDSYENDIIPALALGMTAVFRGDAGFVPDSSPRPHHSVSSLDQLPFLLRG